MTRPSSDSPQRQCGISTKPVSSLRLELVLESPGGLVRTQTAGPHPQSFRFSSSGVKPKFAFPASSQVMTNMLLIQGPHF